eukprot:EG_transcript_48721
MRQKLLALGQASPDAAALRATLLRVTGDLNALEMEVAADTAQEFRLAQARDKTRGQIRASILAEAQVVCTTLGACKELQDWYHTVVVDEAAQATEPQALVPVVYGCRHLVLVGDPKQLPATVLSTEAMKCQFD